MIKIKERSKSYSRLLMFLLAFFLLIATSCKNTSTATTAFYYWKTGFQLNTGQQELLWNAGSNRLYIRFFDINWNDQTSKPYPDAIVQFYQPTERLTITPVIYIRNKTFELINDLSNDSLATHCNGLVSRLAAEQHINYTTLQVDCDWTLTTKDKYFTFLKLLKKVSGCRIEATIRLHQVKFKQQTGVPPVDKGILMFYNMGKLNADLQQPNSIYNSADADKYISYLSTYPLPLNVALPVFSWSVHIRDGKAIQIYEQIGKKQLDNQTNFQLIKNDHCYRAKTSFFLKGVYIKQNDIFKLEEINIETLKTAAKQLAANLPQQQNRTIIYYELANLDLSAFKAETFNKISARF